MTDTSNPSGGGPCEAACCMLAFDDRHLASDKPKDESMAVLTKSIDLEYSIEFDSFEGTHYDSSCSIGDVIVASKPPALCGTCAFCSMLHESLRRQIKIEVTKLSRTVPPEVYKWTNRLKITLKSLEYRRDLITWPVAGSLPEINRLTILILSGFIYLETNGPKHLLSSKIVVPYEIFADKGVVADHLNIPRRPLDGMALSEPNITKIRSWLKQCEENHEKCDNGPDMFLPTRLIDVGSSVLQIDPRLVISSELDTRSAREGLRYIALSYCWGDPECSEPPLKTTHQTFAARTKGIPMNTMPRAFQDAIMLARSLEIRYIWIDSLSIIQNDVLDWQAESGRMADIFSNASLTVIAAASASSHESFLDRALSPICSIPFRSTSDPHMSGHFYIRHRPGKKWWAAERMSQLSEHRWIDRGWTFQEERLAQRVLMFGDDKFFFNCRSEEKYEDADITGSRPDWAELTYGGYESADTSIPLSEAGVKAEAETLSHQPYFLWEELCRHYMMRKLSLPEDKLPALSGMARQFSRKSQPDVYLAGLWKNNLVHDLFWQTVEGFNRPTEYRAPSWSWASIDGIIRWRDWPRCDEGKCKMYCTLHEARTTLIGVDQFGGVKDGYLKVSGGILKVEISWSGSSKHRRHPWRISQEGMEIAAADIDEQKGMRPADEGSRSCCALLVAKCAEMTSAPRGLLLHNTGFQRDGLEEFQRIGVFRIFPGHRREVSKIVTNWQESPQQTILIV